MWNKQCTKEFEHAQGQRPGELLFPLQSLAQFLQRLELGELCTENNGVNNCVKNCVKNCVNNCVNNSVKNCVKNIVKKIILVFCLTCVKIKSTKKSTQFSTAFFTRRSWAHFGVQALLVEVVT